MTNTDLQKLQREMGYGNSDMARLLDIPKTTYQRYFDGSAAVPSDVARKIIEAHRKDRAWMKQLVEKINADISIKFPMGIISEICHD